MSCGISYRAGTNGANATRSAAVFTTAPSVGNTALGTSTLTAPTSGVTITNQALNFINGANETAVTPVNAASVYSFFTTTTYIGAVQNAADTWWAGWTCGLSNSTTC